MIIKDDEGGNTEAKKWKHNKIALHTHTYECANHPTLRSLGRLSIHMHEFARILVMEVLE